METVEVKTLYFMLFGVAHLFDAFRKFKEEQICVTR